MIRANRLENARSEFLAARDALTAAQLIAGASLWRDAMSRAYYAVFHAARALVFLAGAEPRSHQGLSDLFGRLVVEKGLMAAHDALALIRLQAYCHQADYAQPFQIAPDEARREIETAREFVGRAGRLVDASLGS